MRKTFVNILRTRCDRPHAFGGNVRGGVGLSEGIFSVRSRLLPGPLSFIPV